MEFILKKTTFLKRTSLDRSLFLILMSSIFYYVNIAFNSFFYEEDMLLIFWVLNIFPLSQKFDYTLSNEKNSRVTCGAIAVERLKIDPQN